ncbi:MAG: hypothetical protein QF412_14880 [Planctomycetota bacterium]|nr:hypothetical protein [Planctomycetota bacterium]
MISVTIQYTDNQAKNPVLMIFNQLPESLPIAGLRSPHEFTLLLGRPYATGTSGFIGRLSLVER